MKSSKKNLLFIIIAVYGALFAFQGCATKIKTVYIPAGVDSTVSLIADSIAHMLFVDYENQERAKRMSDSAQALFVIADDLWERLKVDSTRTGSAEPADSIEAIRKSNAATKNLVQSLRLQKNTSIAEDDKREDIYTYLDDARALLEEAIELNRFDMTSRDLLANTYNALAQRFEQDQYWGLAAEVLTLLLRMDQSQHVIYSRLARCYTAVDRWDKALEHYNNAEEVLIESAVFEVPKGQPLTPQTTAAAIDSNTLYIYVLNQAISHMRIFQEDETFEDLDRAKKLARMDEHRKVVKGYYDAGMWDARNLVATDKRDTLNAYLGRKDYQAASKLCKELLPNLRTAKATQEIKWQLATLEYVELEQKDAGLIRMKEVVDFFSADSLGRELAKTDTMYQYYLDRYGVMCFNAGQTSEEIERDQVKALKYYEQSASVSWQNQGKAYLAVATISRNDPKKSVDAAKEALELQQQLNPREVCQSLQLIVVGLRKQRLMTEATPYFKRYRECDSTN